jgi:ATP synthase protein I
MIAFGIYGGVGFQLAGAVVGGLLVGNYLDGKWGTSPWLAMTGLVLGSVGGFYNLLKILKWNDQRKKR